MEDGKREKERSMEKNIARTIERRKEKEGIYYGRKWEDWSEGLKKRGKETYL